MVPITLPQTLWREENDASNQNKLAAVCTPGEHYLPDGQQNQRWCQTIAQDQALMVWFQTQAHSMPVWVDTGLELSVTSCGWSPSRTQKPGSTSKAGRAAQARAAAVAAALDTDTLHAIFRRDSAQRVHCSGSRAALFRDSLNSALLPICDSLLAQASNSTSKCVQCSEMKNCEVWTGPPALERAQAGKEQQGHVLPFSRCKQPYIHGESCKEPSRRSTATTVSITQSAKNKCPTLNSNGWLIP